MPRGTPQLGDRSAYDAENYPEIHTNDIDAETGIHHTLGTDPGQAAPGVDSGKVMVDSGDESGYLEDKVYPGNHVVIIKGQHIPGGAELTVHVDESSIPLDDLGATEDNTDLNASVTKHGLLPKLSGVATQFLSGLGTWIQLTLTFLGLTDTPASYAGMGGKAVKVKGTEDGLEFGDISTVANLDDLTDVNAPNPSNKDVLTWDDAAHEWVNAEPTGGSGGVAGALQVTKIKKQTRTVLYDNTLSVAGTWDVQNISQSYDHLEIRGDLRGSGASLYVPAFIRLNGDDQANYNGSTEWLSASYSAGAYTNNQRLDVPANSSTAGFFGSIIVEIQDYAKTDRNKTMLGRSNTSEGDGKIYTELASTIWKNNSAVNRIQVLPSGNNWVAGSRLQIIGIKEEDVVTDVQSAGVATPVNTTKKKIQTRTVLYDKTLEADGAWSAQSISQDYDHLEILFQGRSTGANTEVGISLWLNEDTTVTNYRRVRHYFKSEGNHAVAGADDSQIGAIPGSLATPAQAYGSVKIGIPFYKKTGIYRQIDSISTMSNGGEEYRWEYGVEWQNSANAISQVRIPGNFIVGSRLQIIGIKEEEVVTDVLGSGGLAADQEIYGKFCLYDNTLNVNTASLDIANIDQSYDRLEIIAHVRTDRASDWGGLTLSLNGDTTPGNYLRLYHNMTSADTHTIGHNNDYTFADTPGSTTGANLFGDIYAVIENYAGGHYKQWYMEEKHIEGALLIERINAMRWNNTAAINRLTFTGAGSANFMAGSRLQIFGYKKTRVASSAPVLLKNPFLGRPTGTLLRQYTFDSDVQGWTIDAGGTLTQENGRLKAVNSSGGSLYLHCPGSTVQDGELYFTMEIGADTQVGPTVRHIDNANHYMLSLLTYGTVSATSSGAIYKKVANAYTVLMNYIGANAPGNTKSIPSITIGAVVKVLVRFAGGQISFYINDNLIASIYDTAIGSAGGFGFYLTNGATVYLDNVQIYSIPSNWNIDSYTQNEWQGAIQDVEVTRKKIQTRTVLYDNTLAVAGTWDVQNISQDYDHLEIDFQGRLNVAIAEGTARMRYNGDTTAANYRYDYHISSTTQDQNCGDGPNFGNLPGTTGPANSISQIFGKITNYSKTTKKKVLTAFSSFRPSDTLVKTLEVSTEWTSTSAINRITVEGWIDGQTFVAGSRLQIIGIKEEDVVTDVVGTGQLVESQEIYGKFCLYDDTLVSNGTWDVPNIDQQYEDLEVVLYSRTTNAEEISSPVIRYNNDNVAANYAYQYNFQQAGNATVPGGADSSTQTGWAPAANTNGNSFGITIEKIYRYAGSTWKIAEGYSDLYGTAPINHIRFTDTWKSTSPINRITVTLSAGSFVAGSRLQIFGYKKTRVATSSKSEPGLFEAMSFY